MENLKSNQIIFLLSLVLGIILVSVLQVLNSLLVTNIINMYTLIQLYNISMGIYLFNKLKQFKRYYQKGN